MLSLKCIPQKGKRGKEERGRDPKDSARAREEENEEKQRRRHVDIDVSECQGVGGDRGRWR